MKLRYLFGVNKEIFTECYVKFKNDLPTKGFDIDENDYKILGDKYSIASFKGFMSAVNGHIAYRQVEAYLDSPYDNYMEYAIDEYNQSKDELIREHKLCLDCLGRLVTRKGKYGKFKACENYPKCTFTRNL